MYANEMQENGLRVIVQEVAGKYRGQLVKQSTRDSQLNRWSRNKPEFRTLGSTELFDTYEEAELEILKKAIQYVKAASLLQ